MPTPNDQNQGGVSGDMVSITLPTELLDVLIELLSAAKQKAAQDIGGPEDKQAQAEADLSGLGEEMSGQGRQPMQNVPR